MKLILVALMFFTVSAEAETYYCKLENVPQVKVALQQALDEVYASQLGVATTGDVTQVTLTAMGDAFDYWGTDLLIYQLDGPVKDGALVVGVKVSYNSLMAKEHVAANPGFADITCADTGEVNAALVYVNGENADGEAILAEPYHFN